MKKVLTSEQRGKLLKVLASRFQKNMHRHKDMEWANVQTRLDSSPDKLWSLFQMNETDGEPDVVGVDKESNTYIFYDCAVESPKGRRSLCYDQEGWESRKQHKPRDSAIGMAAEMGVEIMDEHHYRTLQKLGACDTKTSSWILTPSDIRDKGGALFCDFRFGHVFLYHNGAESYYGARGFRGVLTV